MKLRSLASLHEYMAFHGIRSGYELARRAGLKPGVVGHLVSGRRQTCSAPTAGAIERALQCPPGFLFHARREVVAWH